MKCGRSLVVATAVVMHGVIPCPRRGEWAPSALLGAGGCGERPGGPSRSVRSGRAVAAGASLRLSAGLGHGCLPRWPKLGPSPQHRRTRTTPAAAVPPRLPSAHRREGLRCSRHEAFVRSPVTTVDGGAGECRRADPRVGVVEDCGGADGHPPSRPTQRRQRGGRAISTAAVGRLPAVRRRGGSGDRHRGCHQPAVSLDT
jgi:hypothetical protein